MQIVVMTGVSKIVRPPTSPLQINVLESCLSSHLDFPHDPHNSGKRLFDKPRPPSPDKMASGLGGSD